MQIMCLLLGVSSAWSPAPPSLHELAGLKRWNGQPVETASGDGTQAHSEMLEEKRSTEKLGAVSVTDLEAASSCRLLHVLDSSQPP